MRTGREFRDGVRAALPIGVAYLPVAFAIGAASSRLEFTVAGSALWSLTMFSGANQALMLSSLATGTPLLILGLLCIAASMRHLLYGLALRPHIQAGLSARALFGYGLTDEVFATALTASHGRDRPLSGPWIAGLGLTGLAVWVTGTGLGNAAGDLLQAASPRLSEALDFALPALFLALVSTAARRQVLAPMIVAAMIATAMLVFGHPELAIPIGALAALLPVRAMP